MHGDAVAPRNHRSWFFADAKEREHNKIGNSVGV